jgi:hypothetical protein
MTITPDYAKVIGPDGSYAGAVYTWVDIGAGESGDAVHVVGYGSYSVQVDGELYGATVIIEGSNDGLHFHNLQDPSGLKLRLHEPGIEQINQTPRFIRPSVRTREEHGSPKATVTLYVVSTMR